MMKRRIHDFLPNIKDLYTIYENGEIYSDNKPKSPMLTRNAEEKEYQIINFMTINGKKKTYRVHRLVLMVFKPIENYEKMEVNHIDGNKKNNKLENLEWCTSKENQLHAFKTGLQKPRRGKESNFAKLTSKDIQEIFRLREEGLTYKEIAEKIGKCTPNNIGYIIRKKTWKI